MHGSGRRWNWPLGAEVANRLVEVGRDVRVLSRGLKTDPAPLDPRVKILTGDVRAPESLIQALDGVDVVVSAVQGFAGAGGVTPGSVDRDGNVNLISAAEHAGADFVMLSVLGASPDSSMELFRMKYAAEQRLQSSSASWTVVRPDAFTETWLDILAATAGRSGRPVVLGRGTNPVRWVSVDDVAELVTHVVIHPALRGRTLEICGPDPVSMRELARMLMRREGREGDPRRVPRPVLRLMAATVGRLRPELGRQMRAALAMDVLPTNDDTVLRREFTGLPRTSVADVLARRSTS